MDVINLFVPGRLCLFGEHSDWVSEIDSDVKGCTIVSSINQGIYASVKKSDSFVFAYNDKTIESKFDLDSLKSYFSDDFYKYVFSAAYIMLNKYSVSGVEVNVTKNDLPIKKGLSSSAAISILIIRAFNKLYNLNLSIADEMLLAYQSERLIGSKCGKMDQICAYGSNKVNVMDYEQGYTEIKTLNIKGSYNFLIVDLNSSKNTMKILDDLHNAYSIDSNLKDYFMNKNIDICKRAIECLENGDSFTLGKIMNESQEIFDLVCGKHSTELASPLLHAILNDSYIKDRVYGGKGVGSQGDGTAQLLVKSEELVNELITYIKTKYGMDSYKLNIKEKYKLTKAVIPVAGHGTRMYPMTKVINKEFLPLLDKDKILKPAISILVEELHEAGMEEIIFLIGKDDIELYKSLFYKSYDIKCDGKVLEMIKCGESKFNEISPKLKFIIVEKGIGFAKTVLCCKKIVGESPFLLTLCDQLYESNSEISCTKQLINFYENNGNMTISCCPVDVEKSCLYGILKGNISEKNHFKLDMFVEKPKVDFAKENLVVNIGNSDKILAVFGQYILTKEIFEKIENNSFESVTESINEIAKNTLVNGFIVDGKFHDVGNIDNYCETFNNFYNKNK